jgi:hypothetical protein
VCKRLDANAAGAVAFYLGTNIGGAKLRVQILKSYYQGRI